MGIGIFVNDVQAAFKKQRPLLIATAQAIFPEAYVYGMILDGPYATGRVKEEDPIIVRVFFCGDVDEGRVFSKLNGELYGFGGTYTVIAVRVPLDQVDPQDLGTLLEISNRVINALGVQVAQANRFHDRIMNLFSAPDQY